MAAPEAVDAIEPVVAFDPRFAVAPVESASGGWAHDPDPDATSSGFYIDWGEPEPDAPDALASGTSAWDLPEAVPETLAEIEPDVQPEYEYELEAEDHREVITGPWLVAVAPDADESEFDELEPPAADFEVEDLEVEDLVGDGFAAIHGFEPFEATAVEPDETYEAVEPIEVELALPVEIELVETDEDFEKFEVEVLEPVVDDLPFISWRPQSDDDVALPADAFAPTLEAVPVDEEPAEPEEQFVVAGAEWTIGNAVPLVEVRSTGSLVMRRADERWALADVTASADFALEVYVDLRSGPGFGVLFRADIDGEGRMSGYSFDIDPVYEGGGYLVREWRNDRELWDPIAHVTASDPTAMHGLIAVRLTVDDDSLVASVNGEDVLTVASLQQASVDRGRDGASGDRVGIQAWSSSDLVIDELRVARPN